MPSEKFPRAVRERIASRARFRCEYCQSPSDCSASSFSVEHVVPRARGGSSEEANLAWSCMGCNDRKYTAVEAVDPVSGMYVPLFDPRSHKWNDHFLWTADLTQVVGRTAMGRATVAKLALNRPQLVKLRHILALAGEHPAISE